MIAASSRAEFSLKRLSFFPEPALRAPNPDEKYRCYSNAIRLKPDYADAYNNRGVSRDAQGDHKGAVQDYTEAIRLKPDDAAAYSNRGLARDAQGDHKGAVQDRSKADHLRRAALQKG